VTPFSVVVR